MYSETTGKSASTPLPFQRTYSFSHPKCEHSEKRQIVIKIYMLLVLEKLRELRD